MLPRICGAAEIEIGVDRDEEIGLGRARHADALVKSHERVLVAGHRDPVAPRMLEPCLEALREGEDDVLLEGPRRGDGTRIDAAMAGIEHDQGTPVLAL